MQEEKQVLFALVLLLKNNGELYLRVRPCVCSVKPKTVLLSKCGWLFMKVPGSSNLNALAWAHSLYVFCQRPVDSFGWKKMPLQDCQKNVALLLGRLLLHCCYWYCYCMVGISGNCGVRSGESPWLGRWSFVQVKTKRSNREHS